MRGLMEPRGRHPLSTSGWSDPSSPAWKPDSRFQILYVPAPWANTNVLLFLQLASASAREDKDIQLERGSRSQRAGAGRHEEKGSSGGCYLFTSPRCLLPVRPFPRNVKNTLSRSHFLFSTQGKKKKKAIDIPLIFHNSSRPVPPRRLPPVINLRRDLSKQLSSQSLLSLLSYRPVLLHRLSRPPLPDAAASGQKNKRKALFPKRFTSQ